VANDRQVITIRNMELSDLSEVMRIDRQSFSTPWSESMFRFELSHNPAGYLMVAERRGKPAEVIGYIGFWMIDGRAHIYTLAVKPEDRRKGVAKRLITAALARAVKLTASEASLEVRESNDMARSLYEDFGFEVVGRQMEYYKDSGEDALIMECKDLRRFGASHGGEQWIRERSSGR
jgi:ribosomal-protein-alanine N-acetyltransferase